jgi:hypothetical protein
MQKQQVDLVNLKNQREYRDNKLISEATRIRGMQKQQVDLISLKNQREYRDNKLIS